MTKTLTRIGLVITTVYVVVLYLLIKDRLPTLFEISLNELGDFLAGAFGPLAIFWLILGFFQQGKELNQNTRALELQAEELRRSVEQQQELVNVAKLQHETDLKLLEEEKVKEIEKSKANFIILGFGGQHSDVDNMSCTIVNTGEMATNVNVAIGAEVVRATGTKHSLWAKDDHKRIKFTFERKKVPESFNLKISYIDSRGNPGDKSFLIKSTMTNEGFPELECVNES